MTNNREVIFEAEYAEGTGISVGYIHNKVIGNPKDVISVIISGKETTVEFNCRLDEAVCLAAGLNKVAGQILVEQLPNPEEAKCQPAS